MSSGHIEREGIYETTGREKKNLFTFRRTSERRGREKERERERSKQRGQTEK